MFAHATDLWYYKLGDIMEIKQFLNEYFNDDVSYEYSGLGLSNHNYYVTHNNEKYMVRIPNPLTSEIKNRTSEKQALEYTRDCSFSLVPLYYNENTGILVTQYINDAQTYGACSLSNKVAMVAKTLKELHKIDHLLDEYFDPIKKYNEFANLVKEPLFDTSEYQHILSDLPKPSKYCICHNDVVDGNLMFKGNHLYLIDFEYAANNDPLFDIMSFFSENQIMDEEIREQFYSEYFEDQPIPYKELKQWENYQNLLWCTWAMMMWELHHEEVYKEIATWKFKYLTA